MKRALSLLLLASALAGCATTRPPVVPSLEGKPRVQINKEKPIPVRAPLERTNTQPLGE
nr:hypothetical protein [Pseudomonas syringae pv. actinidiae]